jgi:hypothetical protein
MVEVEKSRERRRSSELFGFSQALLSDPDLALVRPGGYLRPPGRFAFYVGCTALWTRLLTRTGPTGAVAMTITRGNAEVAPGGCQDRF